MTLGDVFAQKVVERKKEIDVKRMLRFTVLGSFIVVSFLKKKIELNNFYDFLSHDM